MKKNIKNEIGIIAETYSQLQSVPILDKAKLSYPCTKASNWSTIKALLQATEIGVQNLNDLLIRIVIDINNNEIGKASIKFEWLKDINNLIIKITNIIHILSLEPAKGQNIENNTIHSQAKLAGLLKKTDNSFFIFFKNRSINIEEFLEIKNLDDSLFRIIHDYRIVTREILIWDKNLKFFTIPANISYNDFIDIKHITLAVKGLHLKGDTFFTQFRCLHQIPEILTAETNDYITNAIENIKRNELNQAHQNLNKANILFEITLAALNPIVNDLSFNDYHNIRENLGLTSGSHSVNLHFHLFRDLYSGVSNEFLTKFFIDEKNYAESMRKNQSAKNIEIGLMRLRNLIDGWRNAHIHLPRNNVGGNSTKSLIGSNDAVEAVEKMQQAAHSRDPLNKIATLYFPINNEEKTALKNYIGSERSFDKIIGKEIGEITKKRFADVQNRKGYFANEHN